MNGLLVERGRTNFSDVLEVTLFSKAPTEGDSRLLRSLYTSTKAAVDKFVNAYNGLSQFITANTGYDADTQKAAGSWAIALSGV